MATKPSIPKGTRDFSPVEMLRRKYIFTTIEKVFQKYGFLPLETPAMENLETLTGKYGEEGDRLIFRIQERGRTFESGVSKAVESAGTTDLKALASSTRKLTASEALRYDLTVPFARYVVQHQNELVFPFKRYQIQPVWRADQPQKGRYREFYQCDADVIGSKSLLNEVDLCLVILEVFEELGLDVQVQMNSRKLLQGLGELWNVNDRLVEFVMILDKFDKIGNEVVEEYRKAGFSDMVIREVSAFLDLLAEKRGNQANIDDLMRRFKEKGITSGCEGIEELLWIQDGVVNARGVAWENVSTNLALARGLDYYTGAIFEVKALEGTLQSSICGGGRYDDLTGIFGLKNMSGVGISFGADRIYDVLLETGKFPADLGGSTKLLFANFGEVEAMHCLKLLRQVREAGIAAELYPDQVKMAKQFKYADDKGIAYVAIIGENELKQGIVTVKDMKTGEQKAVAQADLIGAIQ
ncbi:MAG: histidine--tRNA ligase [Flavobacteriales bacterium]|nr:histidine--tRNA ligase [Flavobacteriales bacterium]